MHLQSGKRGRRWQYFRGQKPSLRGKMASRAGSPFVHLCRFCDVML